MHEVFWCGEATFQGSSKVQTFRISQTINRFRYLDRMHPLQELSDSLSNVLFFTIYISLRHNLTTGSSIYKVKVKVQYFILKELPCLESGGNFFSSRWWKTGLQSTDIQMLVRQDVKATFAFPFSKEVFNLKNPLLRFLSILTFW